MIPSSAVARRDHVAGGRNDALDGLRAIAVGLVIVWHTLPVHLDTASLFAPWGLGPDGVRLFFVLSGYLITGILVRARQQAAEVSVSRWVVWRAFYLRRAVRIFPLAYLAIGLAWIVGMPTIRAHAYWYLFYASNFLAAKTHNFGDMGHFWSLAVEEQFYLVWPMIVLLVPLRRLRPVILSLVGLSGLCRVLLFVYASPIAAYDLMPARLDALAFGGLLSLVSLSPAGLAGAGLLLLVPGPFGAPWLNALTTEWALIALSGAAIVAASRVRVLRAGPLVYLGSISYGLYVWHPAILNALITLQHRWSVRFHLPMVGVGAFLWLSGASLAMAALSWRYWESPWNALKDRWPYVDRRHGHSSAVSTPSSRPAADVHAELIRRQPSA